MAEVTLNIRSPEGARQVPVTVDRLTVGRGDASDLVIDDFGLSRVHASIHREDGRVWILDEGSTNGSYVNGELVPAVGTPLVDGDEISIGDHTTITVSIAPLKVSKATEQPKTTSVWPLAVALVLVIAFLIGAGMLASRLLKGRNQGHEETSIKDHRKIDETDSGGSTIAEDRTIGDSTATGPTTDLIPLTTQPRKLYMQMAEEERIEFIDHQAQQIAVMMGNRPYAFNDDVLHYIKKYVDGYASRAGSSSDRLWGEGLRTLYGRASRYAPYIIRSFNARGVPPVVGLYIAMIETEYHDCLESPVGAKGLFQFMPETARAYGVDPADRCNVNKMAPAAANYMADRIAEFGPDAMSVALAIAGYNRSPDSVRRDLHDVLNSENKERSFWTLVANSTKLDRPFQDENIKYVPKFFAAAIVGETPWAFGLQMNPLSTYTEVR